METVLPASNAAKISPAFDKNLASLAPDVPVRAILVLRSHVPPKTTERRLTREERQERIEAMRRSAQASFGTIDAILHRLGGNRLSDEPTALGTITVETNPAGIFALAATDEVQAILEDQPIKPIQ
jgi:hypothetical protein